jgi:hypothetical protein
VGRAALQSGAGRYQHALDTKEQAFLDFVLSHYVNVGVDELDQEKLTPLLRLKYKDSIADALADLGRAEEIGKIFCRVPTISLSARGVVVPVRRLP